MYVPVRDASHCAWLVSLLDTKVLYQPFLNSAGFTVPWVGLQCVIVVFPDHTHLLLFSHTLKICVCFLYACVVYIILSFTFNIFDIVN